MGSDQIKGVGASVQDGQPHAGIGLDMQVWRSDVSGAIHGKPAVCDGQRGFNRFIHRGGILKREMNHTFLSKAAELRHLQLRQRGQKTIDRVGPDAGLARLSVFHAGANTFDNAAHRQSVSLMSDDGVGQRDGPS